jgi:hypothetical protein
MKKIIIAYIVLVACACTKEDIELYDGGTAIYFEELQVNTLRIMDTIEFGFGPTPFTECEIPIRVKATGDVMDVDRRVNVKVENTENALRGRDFDADTEFTFPAGAASSTVSVKLYRGAEDDDTTRFVTLRLEPNEYFSTDLPFRYRTSSDSVDVTRITIQFTSAMPQPRYYMTMVMGYFSVDKLLLVNELCNMTYDKWHLSSVPAMTMIGYATTLRNYLVYRASLGPDMAIKDPSPNSKRGYMCMGAGYGGYGGADVVIPAEWPDAPQRGK